MGDLIERERTDVQVQSVNKPMNPMQLVSIAVQQGADIEKLSKLMDLQERWEASQAKKAFDEAINEFQSRMPVVAKRGNVSYQPRNGGQTTNYDYGRIEDAFKTASPILKETGLSFRFNQQAQQGGLITVTCIISHKLGHYEENSMSAMPDTSGNKDAIKAMASTVSYLRRYTFTGGLGIIFADEDNEYHLHQYQEGSQTHHESEVTSNSDKMPKWLKLVHSGEKTANYLLTFLDKKGIKLSEAEKNQIKNAEPVSQ